MLKKQIPRLLASLLLSVLAMAPAFGVSAVSKPSHATGSSTGKVSDKEIPFRCSVFTMAKGQRVFFGGNDDYINPDSYYWVDPGNVDRYGVVWIGQPDNVQQGINEQGLAYDANGLPRVNVNSHTERIPVSGSYTSYPIHILHECATVEEVIVWIRTHRWHSFMHDQMQFADATGDAVIISAGPDGEVAFTRKPPGDGFLVSTNFNVARPSNGFSYPCWRYDRAQELLDRLVNREEELAVQDAASVLDAVHQEGGTGWTVSSLVADLPNGVIYLYYFHQFDKPVVLHVEKELANPRAPGPLSKLFPEDVRQEATRRYQRIQAQAGRCRWVGIVWLMIVLISLMALFVPSIRGGQGMRFWVPAVILLGPLALLVRFIAGRHRRRGIWRITLLEALGDVLPTVIAFVAFLVIIILVPEVQSARFLQLLLLLLLPFLVGWLGFNGPLLSSMTKNSDGSFLLRRIPQGLVAANMGIGGISIIAIPLINYSLRICTILPPSAWTIVTWWIIAALGSLTGGLLISFYEGWAVRRGFQAWSVLAFREGEVRTPSWRRLWWWIPLSYAALLVGFAAGVILWQVLAV